MQLIMVRAEKSALIFFVLFARFPYNIRTPPVDDLRIIYAPDGQPQVYYTQGIIYRMVSQRCWGWYNIRNFCCSQQPYNIPLVRNSRIIYGILLDPETGIIYELWKIGEPRIIYENPPRPSRTYNIPPRTMPV